MKPVEVSVEVPRPADEVFDFVSDVENNPRWQRGMRSCRWTSASPHGVASTYDQVAHFLGKDVVSSFRVAEFEPGRRIRFTTTRSPFPIDESRTVEPVPGTAAARVSAVVGGDASGFFRLAGPLLRPLVARSVGRDYRRLARLLETLDHR